MELLPEYIKINQKVKSERVKTRRETLLARRRQLEQQILSINGPYAASMARRAQEKYLPENSLYEDLLQSARLGILETLRELDDPQKMQNFFRTMHWKMLTSVTQTIANELPLGASDGTKERAAAIRKRLIRRDHDEPYDYDISSEELELENPGLSQRAHSLLVVGLPVSLEQQREAGLDVPVDDQTARLARQLDAKNAYAAVFDLLRKDSRGTAVLKLRHIEGDTFERIGQIMGLSGERIRQIASRTLNTIKADPGIKALYFTTDKPPYPGWVRPSARFQGSASQKQVPRTRQPKPKRNS